LGELGRSEGDGLSVTTWKRDTTETSGGSGSSKTRGRGGAARRGVVGDLTIVKTIGVGDSGRLLGPWRRAGRRARLGGTERGEQLLGLSVEDRRLLGGRSGSGLGSGGRGGSRGTSRRRSSSRGRRRRVDNVLLVNNLLNCGLVVVVLLGQTLGGRQVVGRRAREGGSLRSHDDTSSDKKTVEDELKPLLMSGSTKCERQD
jgi:hypothetical protein